MKLRIHYPQGGHDEATALLAFMRWQVLGGGPGLIGHEPWVLQHTQGKPTPIVVDEEIGTKVIAIGFFGFVDWAKKEGKLLA